MSKSFLTRFYKWRYSGIIVVPTLVVLVFAAIYYQQAQLDFYDNWSCETLTDYVQDIDVPKGFLTHDEITIPQHDKIHFFLQECQDNKRFSVPLNHLIETP